MATRTRFAPSPTGFLHLGHAYAAISAYEIAKKEGLEFLLRIEDIDYNRCKPEFEDAIYEDLRWLGIHWTGEVLRQSERTAVYEGVIAQLNERGLLYPCFCTRKEIEAEIARSVEAPHEPSAVYPGICRTLSIDERDGRVENGDEFALRLNIQKAREILDGEIFWNDRKRGVQPIVLQSMSDEVLVRKDIGTSYHLSVVVDDAACGIDLIVRGEDLFEVTPIQRVLQELLGYPAPEYFHHSLLHDEQGNRLAKRTGAASIRGRRCAGATPEQILNEIRASQ